MGLLAVLGAVPQVLTNLAGEYVHVMRNRPIWWAQEPQFGAILRCHHVHKLRLWCLGPLLGPEGKEVNSLPVQLCLDTRRRVCHGYGLRRCMRCRVTFYCGPECQKIHWQEHKLACMKLMEVSLKPPHMRLSDGEFAERCGQGPDAMALSQPRNRTGPPHVQEEDAQPSNRTLPLRPRNRTGPPHVQEEDAQPSNRTLPLRPRLPASMYSVLFRHKLSSSGPPLCYRNPDCGRRCRYDQAPCC